MRTFAVSPLLVEGPPVENKRKISVVLPSDVFRRFSTYCTHQGYKKGPLIARLIREHMDEESVGVNGERNAHRVDQPRKR